ncbi:MAG: DEAD/DEAH box helicase [Thermoplasmatota archaeon]
MSAAGEVIFTERPYQDRMIGAAYESLVKGVNRVLEKAPTGTGKTVTFAKLLRDPRILDWLSQFPGKSHALVIAHREELLDQAADKIRSINPGLLVSIEQGDRMANLYSDVVVASIQTLAARDCRRLHRLTAAMQIRIVIVDEAHHAAAKTYRQVLHHLGFLPDIAAEAAEKDLSDELRSKAIEDRLDQWNDVAPKDRLLLGVTATPNRSDAVGLSCVFQTIAFSYALKDAINDGYLVPIEAHAIVTDTSLDDVRTTAGEFNQRDLADTVNTPKRNAEAVAAWKSLLMKPNGEAMPTLGFTVDVKHAHDAADIFCRAGVRAVAISGETPKDDRRLALRQYTDGQLDMLLNCMVLTEGTDLPRTAGILHLKPTKSATLYEQMTGRGLRLFPGKEKCIVVDMVDIASRHTLQAAPILYGLPPLLDTEGKDLRSAEEEFEQFRSEHEGVDFDELLREATSLTALGARLKALNVWAVEPLPEGVLSASTLDWIKMGELLRLSYPWLDGNESLIVQRDMLGHWDVVTTFKPRDSKEVRQRTIITGVRELVEATLRAEQYVATQRSGVLRMKNRSAEWKTDKATPKQIAFLQRLKVPFNPQTLTKGAAGRLLDMAMAKRR